MISFPAEWVETTLDNIADWGSGGTPSRKNEDYYGGDIPWVKTGDLGEKIIKKPSEYITELGLKNSSAKLFPKGAVAIAMYGATIGKASILGIDATTNQACAVGNPKSNVTTSEFLYYFLLNEKDVFVAKGKGGAQPNISQGLIKEHVVYLPPVAEQKEIVDRLDILLAQVEATQARLARIPDIIKHFRQSVLASAVSGKLTEEWRNSKNITSWQERKLGDIVKAIEAGKNLRCIETPPNADEYGIIKISAVTWGAYDEMQSKTLPSKELFLESRRVNVGDFLISRANTIELLGNPVVVENVTKNLMLSDKVLRLVMDEHEKPWVSIFLRSSKGRKEIEGRSTGNQMSMRNIGQKALLDIDIPKPSMEEQAEIVRRVEQLFTYADNLEQQAKAAKARVDNLTQAILAKAFRGELTADWRAANLELISDDNSAAALLARIQVERATAKPRKRATKKSAT